jgi:hypothetical protein
MKVRIKKVPKARTGYQVRGALANDVPAMGGADYDSYIGIPDIKMNRTLKKVPREEANLEAEGNETVMMNTGNIPAFYTIKGPRHAQGGVPLNLPDDSFIYSDFREMKIKDPALLAKFGKSVKGKTAYTPAQLSKQYDINKYREILQDPNSDAIDRKTAEIMIRNYNMKLGALALSQEAKKGFPQGIPAVAKPFMEANGLSEQDFVPPQEEEEAATEPGMEAEGEEMMAEEGQAPETMPDGSPVAMPQGEPMSEPGMPPMQYGGYPMAMYGMSMGGYGMPFYSDPNQMAYGGVPMYTDGGGKTKYKTKDQLKYDPSKSTVTKTAPTDAGWVSTGENKWSRGTVTTGNLGEMEASSSGGGKFKGDQNAYVDQICANMKNPKSKLFYMKDPASFFGPGKAFSDQLPADEKAAILAKLQQCLPAEAIKETEEHVHIEPESVNEEQCECTYPDGSKERMPKNADGTCPPCKKEVEEEVEDEYYEEPVVQDGYAPWWLQDTVNTMGAFGDLNSINKYMPWAANVDLEEPRPTFLDPTRELAAQSEQANIAAQASGAFAGNAQQMGARLANIQGQGAEQAANTLSNINNQNVNIANQFEGQQVDIRNKEQLMNQQTANDLYDKNVIANQQFDNAKRQAKQNLRQQYNTAVTNRWKTDAMNQLYPDYAVDPSVGGQMYFNPTPKTPNPIRDEQSDIEYVRSLEEANIDKDIIGRMVSARMRGSGGGGGSKGPDPNVLAQMYGNMQRGGLVRYLQNGGYVYADTIFPFIM